MIKAETREFFDVINAVTVTRYLAIERPIDLKSPPQVEQFDKSAEISYPDGYSGFVRHCWNRMEDRIYSENHLNMLAQGVHFFEYFSCWQSVVEKYSTTSEALWAEQFNDILWEDIPAREIEKLEQYVDAYFHEIYCRKKLHGLFDWNNEERILPILSTRYEMMRCASYRELGKIEEKKFLLGEAFFTPSGRKQLFTHSKYSVVVYVDYLKNILASYTALFVNANITKIEEQGRIINYVEWNSDTLESVCTKNGCNHVVIVDIYFVKIEALRRMLEMLGQYLSTHGCQNYKVELHAKRKFLSLLQEFNFREGSSYQNEEQEELVCCFAEAKDLIEITNWYKEFVYEINMDIKR